MNILPVITILIKMSINAFTHEGDNHQLSYSFLIYLLWLYMSVK